MMTTAAVAARPTRLLPALIASSLACVAAILAFAGAMGLTGSALASAIVAVGVAVVVGATYWRWPIVPLDERAGSPALYVVSGIATIVAIVQLIRLCIFIVDPAQVGYALGMNRGMGLSPAHSCLSAYYVAARSIDTVPNVYDEERLYSLPRLEPNAQRRPRPMGSFNIDVYEYPPPFLLMPRVLAIAAPEFVPYRMLWFALDGLVVLIAMLAVARAMGPTAGTRALLLAPLVFATDMTIGVLQMGNLQPMVIAIAMLAMVLLDRRQYAAGGTLLAYITVSKLFPGVLLVYLLVRREWRALAWTTAASVALVAISLIDTGWAPYHAFLDHLPRLMDGEAFAAFRNPGAFSKNYSVPGMMFKLGLFGLPGASFGAMKIVGWLYTLILLAITVVVARRTLPREQQPLAWLAIVTLAMMRSPFLPSYATFPAFWMLTLLAAFAMPNVKTMIVVLFVWTILSISLPVQGPDPRLSAFIVLVPQTMIVVLIVRALRDAGRQLSTTRPSNSLM